VEGVFSKKKWMWRGKHDFRRLGFDRCKSHEFSLNGPINLKKEANRIFGAGANKKKVPLGEGECVQNKTCCTNRFRPRPTIFPSTTSTPPIGRPPSRYPRNASKVASFMNRSSSRSRPADGLVFESLLVELALGL